MAKACVLSCPLTRKPLTVLGCRDPSHDNKAHVDLRNTCLFGLDLTGAKLPNAYLDGMDLTGAQLSGADLSGANLSDTLLTVANLNGANLSGANLSGAVLSVADLRNVIRDSGTRITGAITDSQTQGKWW